VNPLRTNLIRLHTRPIEAFANTIRQWYLAAIPGGIVHGATRVGKSFAISYVMEHAKAIFGSDIPVFRANWTRGRISERAFYVRLLTAVGHEMPKDSSRTAQLEFRLLEYLAERARAASEPCLVWFIDEAHFLTDDDLGWWLHVYNAMQERGFQQFTFLVGEPRLLANREAFRQSGDTQFIGRFMWTDYEFEMLKSARDLAHVLHSYDTYPYPGKEKISITQGFAEKAYAAGFRLEQQAQAIWETYVAHRRSLGRELADTMIMQSCTILVAQLLRWANKRDSAGFSISEKVLQRAVQLVA